ncbi:unnamed protein product, partial [Amoebophrya sp. A120]|eukprot:GSA120T00001353001.1
MVACVVVGSFASGAAAVMALEVACGFAALLTREGDDLAHGRPLYLEPTTRVRIKICFMRMRASCSKSPPRGPGPLRRWQGGRVGAPAAGMWTTSVARRRVLPVGPASSK